MHFVLSGATPRTVTLSTAADTAKITKKVTSKIERILG